MFFQTLGCEYVNNKEKFNQYLMQFRPSMDELSNTYSTKLMLCSSLLFPHTFTILSIESVFPPTPHFSIFSMSSVRLIFIGNNRALNPFLLPHSGWRGVQYIQSHDHIFPLSSALQHTTPYNSKELRPTKV